MPLQKWLILGDHLYKQRQVYDALREWEGAFARAFKALPTASNYQEIASELVMRLYWLQCDKKMLDVEQFTKNILKILQKMQKSESIRLHFFMTMLQEFMDNNYQQLFFITSKQLLLFALQHVNVLEQEFNNMERLADSVCQKIGKLGLTAFTSHKNVVHTLRFVLFLHFIKTRVNGRVDSTFETCQKILEHFILAEEGNLDEKILILVEFTVFLSLLDPTMSQIRKNISILKNLTQKYKNIGNRQNLKELRENLISFVQALRQGDEMSYFEKKIPLSSQLGSKNTLLSFFFKEIEKKHGFKQGLPFSFF